MINILSPVASELHGLKDAGYADMARANITKIAQTPELYGTLAHTALIQTIETRRTAPRRKRIDCFDND